MSALRQLIGGLWAAVWLRGRLLGLRLRRVFGGRPSAEDNTDYHLLGADVLVDEVAYEAIELSADLATRLDLARTELLEHAQSRVAWQARSPSVRRRRAVLLAGAALLGLGVAGTGASALVNGSTGVPVIDRLLGVYEQGLDKPGASGRSGPSGSDLQPSPSRASEPIDVELAGGTKVVASFYLARDGRICVATADVDERGSGPVDCQSAQLVADHLAQDDGEAMALEVRGNDVLVKGYVSGDTMSLTGRGPNGPLEVHLGRPWDPKASGVDPLRPFLALGSLGSPPKGRVVPRTLVMDEYVFEAVDRDDRVVRIPR